MTQLGVALLVAATLAAVIALEVNDAPRDDVEPLRMQPVGNVSPTSPVPADHTDDWAATALARPLFSPDRRPVAGAAATAAGRSVPGLPRLTGILVGPFGRSAIFAATNGAKPIVVQEGGRIAAYTVKGIEANQVRLLGPDGAQVLQPSFEAAAVGNRRPAQAPLPR